MQQLLTLQQIAFFFSAFLSDERNYFLYEKIYTMLDLSASLFFVLKKELKKEQLEFKFLPKA